MMKRKMLAAIAWIVGGWIVAQATQCEVEALFVSPAVDQTIETRLIAEIDAAEEQILVALVGFTDEELKDAAVRAFQRGVAIARKRLRNANHRSAYWYAIRGR